MADELDLLDHRRRTFAMYAAARAAGGGEEAWRRWRTARDELFATHPQSALRPEDRAAFDGLPYFPYDPAWRLEGSVEAGTGHVAGISHSGAGTTPARAFATVRFEVDGRTHALSVFWLESYGGGLFLPFRDATAGHETYGGGRYLLDTVKGADLGAHGDRLVLDFNYAYHPSCVHDERWSCPLAPPENVLDVAVRAGERLPDVAG